MIHTVLEDFLHINDIILLIVPLNRHGRVSTVRSRPSERAIKDLPSSGNLGNSDITKLLDDLDNQTEAIRSGQEIGEELLGKKNQTGLRENELERSNGTIYHILLFCFYF